MTATPDVREDATRGSDDSGIVIMRLDAGPADRQTTARLLSRWGWRAEGAFVLTVILAIATFLRLYGLGRTGFNSDEAVYSGQAASIAGAKTFTPLFPIYRAHPLLFQSLLSVVYRFTVSDFAARLLAVAFGVATVALYYVAGKRLYGRRAGMASAALLAVMPYHVVVSR